MIDYINFQKPFKKTNFLLKFPHKIPLILQKIKIETIKMWGVILHEHFKRWFPGFNIKNQKDEFVGIEKAA